MSAMRYVCAAMPTEMEGVLTPGEGEVPPSRIRDDRQKRGQWLEPKNPL
jgi:hypothetical protein